LTEFNTRFKLSFGSSRAIADNTRSRLIEALASVCGIRISKSHGAGDLRAAGVNIALVITLGDKLAAPEPSSLAMIIGAALLAASLSRKFARTD